MRCPLQHQETFVIGEEQEEQCNLRRVAGAPLGRQPSPAPGADEWSPCYILGIGKQSWLSHSFLAAA